MSFRENAVIAIVQAWLSREGVVLGKEAAEDAQLLAVACCESWGHDWHALSTTDRVCLRCGEEGKRE